MARQPFPTDLTDDQWQQVAALLSARAALGRPRKLDLREIVNAILYLLHSDCGWRELPARFPNRSSVRTYYDRWRQDGTWTSICKVVGIRISASVRRGRKSRKKNLP